MNVEVYKIKPDSFKAKLEAAAVYIEVNGKILFLQNAAHDSEPGKWGVPGGKMEAGESPWQGAIRELFEETAITVTRPQLQPLGPLFIRKRNYEYVFHLFYVKLSDALSVQISDEHQDYRWVKAEEIETLSLMDAAMEAYNHYKNF